MQTGLRVPCGVSTLSWPRQEWEAAFYNLIQNALCRVADTMGSPVCIFQANGGRFARVIVSRCDRTWEFRDSIWRAPKAHPVAPAPFFPAVHTQARGRVGELLRLLSSLWHLAARLFYARLCATVSALKRARRHRASRPRLPLSNFSSWHAPARLLIPLRL